MSRIATGRAPVGPQRGPDKHYMYDHKAIGDKPNDSVTSFRSKVAQLKHVFQGEGDLTGGDLHHSISSPSPRSPDPLVRKTRSKSTSEQSARRSELIDPTSMEPQKYFEATNHVERFRYTRAIFAQMEEKSKLEQGKRRLFQPHHNQKSAISPNQMERKRASSDASVLDDMNGQRSHAANGALKDSRKHLGSVDNLGDNGGSRACQQQTKLMHEMSRSEGDLSRERSHQRSHNIDQQVDSQWASKRAMPQQAQPVEKPAPRQIQHSMRPSSGERTAGAEPPSYSQHIREKRAAAAAAAAAAASVSKDTTAVDTVTSSIRDNKPELPQYPAHSTASADGVTEDTSVVATVTSSSHSKRDTKPELPPYPARTVTSSSRVVLNSTSSPSKQAVTVDRASQDVANDDRPPVVMRRTHVNRESRDAYGMVLLPKRRSRDDARLSKEEIEASLSQADRYWRESGDSPVMTDATMMDSTHSSGSGEEMAHSDSGHNLSHSPTDAQQQAWTTMYALNQDAECREGEPWEQANDRSSKLSMDSNVEEVIALRSPSVPKDEVLEEPFRHHNRSPSPQHIAMERHSAEESARVSTRLKEDNGGEVSAPKTTLEDWITTPDDSSNTDMTSSMLTKEEEENGTDL